MCVGWYEKKRKKVEMKGRLWKKGSETQEGGPLMRTPDLWWLSRGLGQRPRVRSFSSLSTLSHCFLLLQPICWTPEWRELTGPESVLASEEGGVKFSLVVLKVIFPKICDLRDELLEYLPNHFSLLSRLPISMPLWTINPSVGHID